MGLRRVIEQQTKDMPSAESVQSDASLAEKVRLAKIEKAMRKAEIAKALREAREKNHVATSAEKKAIAKEIRAEKLAIRAEAARLAAMDARDNANQLAELAGMASEFVKIKYLELRNAIEKLRIAERFVKKARKLEGKQYRMKQRANKKSGKAKLKDIRKINNLKTVGISSP